MSIVDYAAIWFVLSKAGGSTYQRLILPGIGWAIMHHISYYFPGYWIHARSLEFSYVHLANSFTANLETVRLLFISKLSSNNIHIVF